MWLSNEEASKYPDPTYVHGTEIYTVGLSSMGGYYRRDSDGMAVGAGEAVAYPLVTKNGSTYREYQVRAGYSFVRVGTFMRLFGMHQFGWILPHLSPRLGSEDTLRRRISIHAPVMRAFDIVRTKTFPMVPDGTGEQQRYWYVNPKHGPMMGACLPPTSEDMRYSDGLKKYDWDGKDISGARIAAGSSMDLRSEAERTGASFYGGTTSTDTPPPAPAEDYGQVAGQTALSQSLATYIPSAPAPTTSTRTFVKGVR